MKSVVPKKIKKGLKFLGSILATFLFLWLLARQDWDAVLESLSHLSWSVVFFALGLYALGIFVNALRWKIILAGVDVNIPFDKILKLILTGAFSSNFLPSTIGGDTIRILGASKYSSKKVAFASVVLDRALNVLAMSAILPLSWNLYGAILLNIPIFSTSTTEEHFSFFSFFSLKKWLKPLLSTFLAWVNKPYTILLALVVSWLSLTFPFLAIWILALNLGIDVSLLQVIGTTAITYFLSLLPIAVNGYGVREIAITTLYTTLGASIEQATTLALITRFLMMLVTLPGIFWMSSFMQGSENQNDSQTEIRHIMNNHTKDQSSQ